MTVPPRPNTPPRTPANGAATNMHKTAPSSAARTNQILADMGSHNGTHTANATGIGQHKGGTPGVDFMSNDDIRAFCEHLRKDHRNRATERAMDADHLEAVLRTIPDAAGSRSGSRARARRVSRWLKKIAAAEKASQKYAAMLYGTFEREYEAQLRTISPARPKQNQRAPFSWR